ncbi:hypothetical protein B0H34DRAFT_74424 [Crassisporium funariophilum]|nr:hypothetical protein B0H34DRAFT_74424 [Crassisporium funariophilum]
MVVPTSHEVVSAPRRYNIIQPHSSRIDCSSAPGGIFVPGLENAQLIWPVWSAPSPRHLSMHSIPHPHGFYLSTAPHTLCLCVPSLSLKSQSTAVGRSVGVARHHPSPPPPHLSCPVEASHTRTESHRAVIPSRTRFAIGMTSLSLENATKPR